jgi:transcriptional regulator with XRE-family HTH domain
MAEIDASKKFDEMFSRLEASGELQIEVTKIKIAEDIIAALERLSLTQADLASRLGTSRAYVTKILQGTTNFTIDSLARISQALNCRLDVQIGHAAPVPPTVMLVLDKEDVTYQTEVQTDATLAAAA